MLDHLEFKGNLEMRSGRNVPLLSGVINEIVKINFNLFWRCFFFQGLPWSFRLDGHSRNPRTKGFLLFLFWLDD